MMLRIYLFKNKINAKWLKVAYLWCATFFFNIYVMKHLKTFEGLFDRFKKQESSARKIYSAIVNSEITDVIKEEKPGAIGNLNFIKFKFEGVDYSVSRISVYNETEYVLKMGSMKLDCSQKISKSIYDLLWYGK
jgi:hypothetical protein